ncbi:hypothetical protein G5I_09837 [Acromyrmex echinatior]|uniref:Uncharacterized protein n=1 Tax=Acromyrmex echinatior TaxID=103372 RepID=F4WV46_ACREC|nr:hypothetical protein G5I_09837 [Acromyrmex echinatior]
MHKSQLYADGSNDRTAKFETMLDNRQNFVPQSIGNHKEWSELLSKLHVLATNINCSFESVTAKAYLKNAFLEKCLRQKNISEFRD